MFFRGNNRDGIDTAQRIWHKFHFSAEALAHPEGPFGEDGSASIVVAGPAQVWLMMPEDFDYFSAGIGDGGELWVLDDLIEPLKRGGKTGAVGKKKESPGSSGAKMILVERRGIFFRWIFSRKDRVSTDISKRL